MKNLYQCEICSTSYERSQDAGKCERRCIEERQQDCQKHAWEYHWASEEWSVERVCTACSKSECGYFVLGKPEDYWIPHDSKLSDEAKELVVLVKALRRQIHEMPADSRAVVFTDIAGPYCKLCGWPRTDTVRLCNCYEEPE